MKPSTSPSSCAWVADAKTGRTVEDLAEYMIANGLKFAPATSRDEGSFLGRVLRLGRLRCCHERGRDGGGSEGIIQIPRNH